MGTINGIGIGIGMRTKYYSKPTIELTLTSKGDGTGVTKLTLQSSESTIITLVGNARFYSDTLGTLDESSTITVAPFADKIVYIKCTSGISIFKIEKNKLIKFHNPFVASPANNLSFGGNVEKLTALNTLTVQSNNTLSGNISGLTALSFIVVQDNNTLTFPNVTNITGLCHLYIHTTVNLTSANVNQILADFWTNRNAVKPRSERTIIMSGSPTSGAPTGQGIIDKANLAAYRSPTPPGTDSLWSITTK